MEHFDLVVIGGGPSGYAGAMRAVDFRKRVLLIEKHRVGGAGVYDGVLTSKTMWEHSMRVSTIREAVPGFQTDYRDVRRVVDEAVAERKEQMEQHLHLLATAVEKDIFHFVHGTARFVDAHTVEIALPDGTKRMVTADYILVATGSRPRYIPNIPIDEETVVTSDGIRNFTDFPESMVVLGAGVIGCEFATIFSNYGRTKVFLIDKADRILPFEDEDIAETVTQNLLDNGAHVHHGASLVRMEIKNGRVEYELKFADRPNEVFTVDKALVSVGRIPNLESLGLEEAGVKLDDRNALWNDDTQTNVSHIYAAGDVSLDIALVNVGEREARHAVVRMFGDAVKPISYKNISTIMFLNPEVAAVGVSEQEAKAQGIPFKMVKLDYQTNARAIAMRKTKGFFKIIVTNDHGMRILGMRAVGEHASSAIQAVAYLVHTNQGIRELAEMMHPHPSIIEGIQECLRMLLGKSIYKAAVFKDKLKAYVVQDGKYTPIDHL
jgi:dihydrolipoamide dehydrogenase